MWQVTAQWTTLSLDELAPLPISEAKGAAPMFVTTGRISPKGLFFSDKHLQRLERSWKWSQIPSPFPAEILREIFARLPQKLPWEGRSLGILRITYQGEGWSFQFRPLEEDFTEKPLSLVIYRDDSWRDDLPRFLKKPQPQSLQHDKQQICERWGGETDVLICDSRGGLIESSICSLIFKDDRGDLVIPKHSRALESLSLLFLQERLEEKGKSFQIKSLNLTDLQDFKGAWLTNCVRGVRAVHEIYGDSGALQWSSGLSESGAKELQDLLFRP